MSDRREVLKKFEEQKKETEERVNYGIEHYRKGTFTILVKDVEGNPVNNAKIHVNQKKHEFKYGANLFMLDELETEEKNEKYKEYFRDTFNMATLPFYWSDLEPEKGKTRYKKDSPKIYRRPPIDLCMEFCEENGIEPREHALAYDHFFPEWLKNETVDSVKKELTRRYKEISERYADRIQTIEVTNETWWENGKTSFYEEDDFVEWCFKEAEKIFPNNQLGINEYAMVWYGYGRNRDTYYMQIENALKKGARIDAIGMQFHMFYPFEKELEETRFTYDPQHLYKIMDKYSEFNRPIQITEITIPAYSTAEEDENLQAEIIKNLYSIWFSHKNVEQIIYWNLVDGYAAFAPQGDFSAGENYYRGGLIRFDMTPKPAYFAIKNLFEKEWHTESDILSDKEGNAKFRGFFGEYEVKINGKQYTINTSAYAKNEFEIIL